jgi:hypothetical protein
MRQAAAQQIQQCFARPADGMTPLASNLGPIFQRAQMRPQRTCG